MAEKGLTVRMKTDTSDFKKGMDEERNLMSTTRLSLITNINKKIPIKLSVKLKEK